MSDDVPKLSSGIRDICVVHLARIGGKEWAEEEVDTPEFIEMAERLLAKVFNEGTS